MLTSSSLHQKTIELLKGMLPESLLPFVFTDKNRLLPEEKSAALRMHGQNSLVSKRTYVCGNGTPQPVVVKKIVIPPTDDKKLKATCVEIALSIFAKDVAPHLFGVLIDDESINILTKWCNEGSLEEYLEKLCAIHPGVQKRACDTLKKKDANEYLLEIIKKIALPLAIQLQQLHNSGILHRDLKLANILVHNESDNLQVFLCDFGSASSMGPPSEDISALLPYSKELFVSSFQTSIHTPWEDQSIETSESNTLKYITKEDVWTFGLILIALWRGYPLGGQKFDTFDILLKEIPAHCPPAFKSIIKECLTFNITERISLEEIIFQLKNLLADISNKIEFVEEQKHLVKPLKARWTELLVQKQTKQSLTELTKITKDYPIANLPRWYLTEDGQKHCILRSMLKMFPNKELNSADFIQNLILRPADIHYYKSTVIEIIDLYWKDPIEIIFLYPTLTDVLLLFDFIKQLYSLPNNNTAKNVNLYHGLQPVIAKEKTHPQVESPPVKTYFFDPLEDKYLNQVPIKRYTQRLRRKYLLPHIANWTVLLTQEWNNANIQKMIRLINQYPMSSPPFPMYFESAAGEKKHVIFEAISIGCFQLVESFFSKQLRRVQINDLLQQLSLPEVSKKYGEEFVRNLDIFMMSLEYTCPTLFNTEDEAENGNLSTRPTVR